MTATAGLAQYGFAESIVAFSDSLSPAMLSDTSLHTIRNILVEGNKKTRNEIVAREIAVQSGIKYMLKDLRTKLRQTKEQLMNTSLFVDVVIEVIPIDETTIDVKIDLKERWYLFPIPYFKVVDRNWNVWINDYKASIDRTNLGLKLEHNNISGRNDKLNLWLIFGYTQQLEFKYTLPYADKKLQKGYVVGFQYGRNRELNYATERNRQMFLVMPEFGRQYVKAEAALSYRKGSKLRMYAKSTYGFEKIDSAFYRMNPNYLSGKTQASYLDLSLIYQYYNVDYIPYPLRGWYVDLFATQRLSDAIPMTQVGGKALATWRFLPKTYVNFQLSFAATVPSANQSYYNTKLIGYGSLYMQGLEYNVVDGTFGFVARTTFRNELFKLTFKGPDSWKTYSRIPFRFFLKTYGNIGYGYLQNPGTNYMNNTFLHTAGFGLDIATIYDLVFKLEYSWNQYGQNGFFIHTAADF